jgi:multidrug efflux pump
VAANRFVSGYGSEKTSLFSRFFIDRPIFAAVLSIVITLAGFVSALNLPLALYPPVSPPVVQVDCNYPGASAEVVSESVATPIEQQVNGVENMLYMSSQCTNDGSYNLTVTFKHGVDLNMCQVLVQNRVNLALPMLPDVIKQTGVTTRKRSPDILLAIAVNSPVPNKFDQLYLSNFALMRLKDEIARLPGVSEVTMLGQRDYSMRIWVDPEQLASRGMTANDVVRALRAQNAQVATGQIGQPPVPQGQPMQITLSTLGRLSEPEQYADIIVKGTPEGRTVRIKDIATKVELGSKNENMNCQVNGKPSVSMAIFQLPDANALDTAVIVKDKIKELARDFPPGLQYEIRYDTTPYISESINEVFRTLREAVLLVAVVVLLFLQNWRSAIIPLIAVPVAIIGTFAALAIFGFSLNNLTLFGLVLAIGIVVDDAIVVVEAVEHHIEQGMSPHAATVRAMEEVSGPVVAIGLVLSAVFVPCAFISGIIGQFFRQFALTIATSTIISAFNSLTLSPALAAMLLRPRDDSGPKEALPKWAFGLIGGWVGWFQIAPRLAPRIGPVLTRALESAGSGPAPSWAVGAGTVVVVGVLGWLLASILNRILVAFFGAFNAGFRRATDGYTRLIGMLLRVSLLVLVGYAGLLYHTTTLYRGTAKGFVPSQDMGYIMINVQLPDSASDERTRAVMTKIEKLAHTVPGIKHSQAMAGMSMLLSANGSNFGSMFVILDEFSKRERPDLSGDAIQGKLRSLFEKEVPEAMITVLGPPPVRGVGRAGGFKLLVEDRGDLGPRALQKEAETIVAKAKKDSRLVGMTSVFRANVPQLYVDVNRSECMTKEVPLKDLFDTLRIYLGSLYVNDFNKFGRTWQVVVQADPKFRNDVADVARLQVRNADGQMVPVGAVASIEERNGPLVLTRYNMYPAAPVNGAAAPGVSSGEAIKILEQLCRQDLPQNMAFEWTELAFLEIQAGNTAITIFGLAVVTVFLVLAAQYESWSLPLAVILVVPMCLLGAIIGVRQAEQDINIFTQIGFVVLVGLASKNAILIVEFAKHRREKGDSPRVAAMEACRLRLRPIIMTSFAFILGVVPLITSHGAGHEMRQQLGMTVFSGMLGVTLFGIFLTPVFFYVIDRLGESSFFQSGPMRRVSTVLMAVLRLGYVHQHVKKLRPRRKPRPIPELAPEPSGGVLVEHKQALPEAGGLGPAPA